LPSLERSTRPDQPGDHDVEIKHGSHYGAELVEDLMHVQARTDDPRHRGEDGQPAPTMAFLVKEHDVLDQRANELGDPLAGLDVGLRVHIRGEAADDECPADALSTVER